MVQQPKRLGDFEVVREIGRGGMGVVYEAIQVSLNRRVALKVLPPGATPEQRDIERFQREAQAAGSLDHPNIVPIYAQGEEEGTHYYAMKLVQGRSLDQIIHDVRGIDLPACTSTELVRTITTDSQATITLEERPTVPLEEGAPEEAPPERRATDLSLKYFRTAARLIMEVAEALEYAHSEGVIHRDIKPHNLILTAEGHLVVTDFGLARFLSAPSITVSGEMMGTPAYMSPELVRAEQQVIDLRTDVYSLGITLYEMLALEVPFRADTREALLRQILVKDPPPLRRINPRIPRDLETICQKAIEKDPDRRYQSAELLAHDLHCFLEGLPITARPIGPVGRVYRRALRRKALTAALAGVLVAVIVGTFFGLQSLGAHRRVEVEKQRADQQQRLAQQERLRAEAEERRAEGEQRRREAEERRAEVEAAAKLEAQRQAKQQERLAQAERRAKEAEAAAKREEQRWNLLAEAHRFMEAKSYLPSLAALKQAASIRRDNATDLLFWALATRYLAPKHVVLGYIDDLAGITSVVFSPNGKVLASGSADNRVRLWDVATGRQLRVLTGHRDRVTSLAFSPDGKTLASGSRDETVKLWDVATGREHIAIASGTGSGDV